MRNARKVDAQGNKIASARLYRSCAFEQSCKDCRELASRFATPRNRGNQSAIAAT
jgi:hypothetical protein